MGQGQEVHARRLISVSMAEGRWVLLQNCHLGLDFMDEMLETVSSTHIHRIISTETEKSIFVSE